MVPVADASAICDVLDAVRDDRNVAGGVIVHGPSRGGSAIASDRSLRAIRRVRERKPVIACLGWCSEQSGQGRGWSGSDRGAAHNDHRLDRCPRCADRDV